jgi:hypothetical protein
MAAFSQRVTSITQDTIVPKVFDNYLSDNFVTFRFIANAKKWTGETLKFPIKVAKNTLGGSFSGLDAFSTSTVESRITLSYDLRAYEIPVAVPGLDQLVNGASESRVLDLVKVELESSANDAADDIGTMFYLDGTGNANKDFNGFGNLIDDGTTATNVGNQSRSTYPMLAGIRTASGGTMTLTKLDNLYTGVSGGSASKQKPTVIISDETVWNLGTSLLAPTVQANYQANGFPMVTRTSRGAMSAAEMKGALGFTSIIYRGIPWVADEKSTSQTVWFVNEEYIQWYGAKDPAMQGTPGGSNIDGVYSEISGNTGLQFSGMMKPVNQYGEVGHIYLFGNLVTTQPRRQGRLTGVTGV